RGVDLLDAEESAYPEREARKRDQFAWSEFLDQFKLWLKLLDVLGIIKSPLVGCTRAPDVRARSFHNPRIADIEDHLTAGEVSDHGIEERFHFRFAQVVQHSLGDKQPRSVPWNLVQPAQIVQRRTDEVIGGSFGKQLAAQIDDIRVIHVEPLNASRRIDTEGPAVHAAAHLQYHGVRVIGQIAVREQ